jgi:hypothetical protein
MLAYLPVSSVYKAAARDLTRVKGEPAAGLQLLFKLGTTRCLTIEENAANSHAKTCHAITE